MKIITAVLSLMLIGAACHAQQVVNEISWDRLGAKGDRTEVIAPSGSTRFAQLKVDNPSSKPLTVRVGVFGNPKIKEKTYAVTGMVRYEHVEGQAYLEMWSVLPGRQRFFTKTLDSGLLAPLTGSSGWRRFSLPFDLTGSENKPKMLEINVVFAGKGTVYLGPLSIVEPAGVAGMMGMPGQWWSPLWAAKWTGALGGGFGALAGILGALSGLLIPRGRGRRFLMGVFGVLAVVSAGTLCAGLVALATRQPYWVYAPLLLTGIVATPVIGGSLLVIRKRYEAVEMRKMQAADATE